MFGKKSKRVVKAALGAAGSPLTCACGYTAPDPGTMNDHRLLCPAMFPSTYPGQPQYATAANANTALAPPLAPGPYTAVTGLLVPGLAAALKQRVAAAVAPPPDPTQARLDALELQVKELQELVEELERDIATLIMNKEG